MLQPSLFEEPAPAEVKPFYLVPHEVFRSWPPDQQFRYCAARDRAAARGEADPVDRQWFLDRAATYDALAV